MNAKTRFTALSNSSSLEILLPQNASLDVEALNGSDLQDGLVHVQGRELLFFDEEVLATVILRSSRTKEEVLELLPVLDLVLAVHASDNVSQSSGNNVTASTKFDLNSKTFAAHENAEIIVRETKTVVFWNLHIHLSRPRGRVQQPVVHFAASISISPDVVRAQVPDQKQMLKSYESLPVNVVEPLRFDPHLRNSDIYLAEPRVTKLAPRALISEDAIRPIRATIRSPIPASPALYTRVKYSSVADTIVASLHLEASGLITGFLHINDANLKVTGLDVDALFLSQDPVKAGPGDENVFLYRIFTKGRQGNRRTGPGTGDTPVTISIKAEVFSKDLMRCSTLSIVWQTQLDLSNPDTEPEYSWSMPLSTGDRRQSDKNDDEVAPKHHPSESSITFNITGPPTVYLNERFTLAVQCNNTSTRTRQFALKVMPMKHGAVADGSDPTTGAAKPPPTSNLSNANRSILQKPHDLQSDARTSGSVSKIFDTTNSNLSIYKPPNVLPLSPHLHIGPIPPSACFETEMTFQAIKTGIADFGMLQILDFDSKRVVDVYELPDVTISNKGGIA